MSDQPQPEIAVLTQADHDDLIRAFFEPDDDCSHNMTAVFAEVRRIIVARQREWENAVLRECVENMPATGDCADFMSVVSTAMLALRTPPASPEVRHGE